MERFGYECGEIRVVIYCGTKSVNIPVFWAESFFPIVESFGYEMQLGLLFWKSVKIRRDPLSVPMCATSRNAMWRVSGIQDAPSETPMWRVSGILPPAYNSLLWRVSGITKTPGEFPRFSHPSFSHLASARETYVERFG